MNGVAIRQARAQDAPIVFAMIAQLVDFLGEREEFTCSAEIIRQNGFGPDPMFHCMIAEIAQEPVGLALYFRHFSTTKGRAGVYVQDLWVDPAARGASVGPQLLAAVAAHATEAWNAAYMKLTVHTDNPRAQQFYTRLGFSVDVGDAPMTLAGTGFAKLRGAL